MGRETVRPQVSDRREVKFRGAQWAKGHSFSCSHRTHSADFGYLWRWQVGQSDLVVGSASHSPTLYEASLSFLWYSDGRLRNHTFSNE